MKALISTRTSLMPQTSDFRNTYRSANSNFKSPLIDPIPFAPQYSESEHQKRILEWTTSIKPPSLDDEDSIAAQSFLIDEGVRKLRDWDIETKVKDPNNKSLDAATRLDLISDLKKIKRSIDPQDNITPRVVVHEFEKFMEIKKSIEPKKVRKTNLSVTQPDPDEYDEVVEEKRVSFNTQLAPPGPSRPRPKSNWRKSISKTKVGFTVTYPKANKNPHVIDKHGKLELHKQVEPVVPNNDPLWWKRKIRQGFLQTEEMMLRLVNQRRNDEISYNIGPHLRESDRKIVYEQSFNPKTYASIAARATRVERQRLDKSMERLKQRHEECFGKSCPNPGDTAVSKTEDLEAVRTRRNKQQTQSEKHQSKPVDMLSSFPDRTRDPIDLPKSITAKILDPFQEKKPEKHSQKDYLQKLRQLTLFGAPAGATDPPGGKDDKNESKNPNLTKNDTPTQFKVPTVPIPATPGTSRQNPDVKVLYLHQTEGQNPQAGVPFGSPSDRKMGSEKWPMEYLSASTSHKPDFHAKEAPKIPRPTDKMIAMGNYKNGKSEWMTQLNEARKVKAIRDEAKVKDANKKQKAKNNALYKELLLNKTRIKNEVEFEKLKMKEGWKYDAKHAKIWNKKDKDKLPERLRREEDDLDDRSTTVEPQKKEPLKYTWKERPKGLNIWLEGVMAKAKEEKETKNKRNKDLLIPLSSYQF